ncbi:MAG: hypothetical protein CI952_77 [Methanohalophilus sp.]|jgi:catalase (peroxidase I)|nr:MAG: hypothetical protein CI952_77 [Methanohalophilus sp.]
MTVKDRLDDGRLMLKWRKLIDNAKFKSSNVGRASPVPSAWIRADNKAKAHELRDEIGGGRIKSRGSQAFLILGPSILRDLLEHVSNDIRKNSEPIDFVKEWLKLLNENRHTKGDRIEQNRRRIDELKTALIEYNKMQYQQVQDMTFNEMVESPDVLRNMLSTYEKVPEECRTEFQERKIKELYQQIAEKCPESPEARFLQEKEALSE